MDKSLKNYALAVVFAVSAILAGWLLQRGRWIDVSPILYSSLSLFSFTVGTMGRLGFRDLTWGGSSKNEKMDFRLFLIFYFIGLSAGIASLDFSQIGTNSPAQSAKDIPEPTATSMHKGTTDSPGLSASIVAAIISASVSIFVTGVSRWVFSRSDRRFAVLVLIQEQLLKLQKDPPWDTNGENVYFEKVRKTARAIDPYFDRLRMVSFPARNCSAQKAWKKFRNLQEEEWTKEHPNRPVKYSGAITKEEYLAELQKVLDSLK